MADAPDPRGFPAYYWQWGTAYVAWFCEPDAPGYFLEWNSEPQEDHAFGSLAAVGTEPEPGQGYVDLGHEHCFAEGCVKYDDA